MEEERDMLEFDVCIIGAGPAGLACAIHLTQLVQKHNQEIEAGTKEGTAIDLEDKIAVIEKGSSIGAHGFSGAVMDITPLTELIPDYKEKNPPSFDEVKQEGLFRLSQHGKMKIPFHMPGMANKGKHVVSLSKLTQWLGEIAEEMGIMLIPEFAAVDLLLEDGKVKGVRTDDKEYDSDGKPQMLGADVHSKALVLAEGPRGTITKKLTNQFSLRDGKDPDTYEYGVKEIWEVPEGQINPGDCYHTMGYPMGKNPGGTFIYGMSGNLVTVGLVYYLKSADPLLDAHRSLQDLKQHPFVKDIIANGKLVAYGGKALPASGYKGIPKLYTDGALLVGDSANLLNVMSFKGVHYGIISGMLAAETLFEGMLKDNYSSEILQSYETKIMETKMVKELKRSRNFAKAVAKGFPFPAIFDLGFQMVFNGFSWFEGQNVKLDREYTKTVKAFYGKEIAYPEPVKSNEDNQIVDKLTDVYQTGTAHDEHQPSHLKIGDPTLCTEKCYTEYLAPCTHFCPAQVYEWQTHEENKESNLVVNFSNCIHCKTCDIKCPFDNIEWTPPQGGEGPKYSMT